MFNFIPVSEDEIAKQNLLDKGEYKFFVKKAEQKRSKAGNPMIELQLSILDANNREHLVFDYLMDHEALRYKIRHFCYSIGLGAKYESGAFSPEECVEKVGHAKIYIKEDASGQYKPKNAVGDYLPLVKKEETELKIKASTNEDPFDDLIPF